MKKIISVMLAVLMLASLLAACGSKTEAPKTLKVATSPDFAPMEFVSGDEKAEGNDKYAGFDITLAKYLASEMGLELEIVPMSFDACQTAVAMGSVDMAISGFSWTEERSENYNLSNQYDTGNEDQQCIITLAENGDIYATAEGLAGCKVGAQIASLQASLLTEQLPECEMVTFTDITTALMMLRNGDFVAIAVADGNAESIIANNADIAKSGFFFEVDEAYTGNVVMLKKGADELTKTVNDLLEKSKEAGLWPQWYDQAKKDAVTGMEVSFD